MLDDRERRETAATRYRPSRVELLLVAEAPPLDVERYFYFEEVRIHDSLFRYVVRLTLGSEPARDNKVELLAGLRDAGVFLIDLCLDAGHTNKAELRRCNHDLVSRASALAPEHIILIKAPVFDAVYRPLLREGLPVVNERIPFPGSGHQAEFEEGMRRALDSIGWPIRPRVGR